VGRRAAICGLIQQALKLCCSFSVLGGVGDRAAPMPGAARCRPLYGLTVNVSVLLSAPAAFLALNLTRNVPAVVGLPEMTPE
jgi:hypothetical protein